MAETHAEADRPVFSAITKLTSNHLPQPEQSPDHALALQVLHNLQHEHNWTALQLHTVSPVSPSSILPRPLISGLSPHRLYMHPDEQIELLKKAKRNNISSKKDVREVDNTQALTDGNPKAAAGIPDSPAPLHLQAQPEREWVLPTRLNEKWSLRRMADIFDGISLIPSDEDVVDAASNDNGNAPSEHNKWRTSKRVLMAIVDHDSTIVYYIVQEGLVKPRQN